jgi:hypothetical protein
MPFVLFGYFVDYCSRPTDRQCVSNKFPSIPKYSHALPMRFPNAPKPLFIAFGIKHMPFFREIANPQCETFLRESTKRVGNRVSPRMARNIAKRRIPGFSLARYWVCCGFVLGPLWLRPGLKNLPKSGKFVRFQDNEKLPSAAMRLSSTPAPLYTFLFPPPTFKDELLPRFAHLR